AQRGHETVIRHFRSVGNKPEYTAAPIVINGLDDLIAQTRAERLTLAVNIHVVAAREIDAFERAFRARQGRGVGRVRDRAAFLDHHDVTGRDFAHLLGIEIEYRHEWRALRSERDDFVVLEIETR